MEYYCFEAGSRRGVEEISPGPQPKMGAPKLMMMLQIFGEYLEFACFQQSGIKN